MTPPRNADEEADVQGLVDDALSELRFATASPEAVATFVAREVEAQASVIVKAYLGDASRQVTVENAAVTAESAPVAEAAEKPKRPARTKQSPQRNRNPGEQKGVTATRVRSKQTKGQPNG